MNPRRFGLVELHLAVLLFGLAGLFGKLLALPPTAIVFGRTTFATPALLGLGCTALAHTLFLRSFTSVRAQPASVVTSLETVYGVLFAFVLLGEVPAGRTLVGGGVILGATVVATWRRVSLQAPQEPSPALTDMQRSRR